MAGGVKELLANKPQYSTLRWRFLLSIQVKTLKNLKWVGDISIFNIDNKDVTSKWS